MRFRTTSPTTVTRPVGRGRRLSEGALVEASVRAHLLGVPLLRLEAMVLVTPATVRSSSIAASGDGLAEAVRSINEGAEVLAELHRDGAS